MGEFGLQECHEHGHDLEFTVDDGFYAHIRVICHDCNKEYTANFGLSYASDFHEVEGK